jgi:hypothetical protein
MRSVEVRPHLGASLAAGGAGEVRFDAGEADIIGPAVAVDRYRVAAAIIGAIDL